MLVKKYAGPSKCEVGDTPVCADPFDLRLLIESQVCKRWVSGEHVLAITLDYLPTLPSFVLGNEGRVVESLMLALQSAAALADEALVQVEMRVGPETSSLCVSVDVLRRRRYGVDRDVPRVARWMVGELEFSPSISRPPRRVLPDSTLATGWFVIASPHWPTRYYLARDLRTFGVMACYVASAEGLRRIVSEGALSPRCAIVDQCLWDSHPQAISHLRNDLSEVSFIGLQRSPTCVSQADLEEPVSFEFQLETPLRAHQIRELLRNLQKHGSADVYAA